MQFDFNITLNLHFKIFPKARGQHREEGGAAHQVFGRAEGEGGSKCFSLQRMVCQNLPRSAGWSCIPLN